MTWISETMDELADQIQTQLGTVIPELQVGGRLMPNPTPPAIDIYPSDPFAEAIGFGRANKEYFFNVRARVSTADNLAGQDLLLAMMDPDSDESVEQAILSTTTLTLASSEKAYVKDVDGPSSYGVFPLFLGGQLNSEMVGVIWRVRILPD